MKLNIIYRACDKVESVNGLKRPFGLDKKGVLKSCFSSLVKSLDGMDYSLTVVGDSLSKDSKEVILTSKAAFLDESNLGNAGSLSKQFEIADKIENLDEWIYFCEDDYLHDSNTFSRRLIDFVNFASESKFVPDVFIHPTDYPDQYTRSLGRNYIFQTNSGYWREVSSTTATFMCQVKSYKKYASFFKMCGPDDGRVSSIFKKTALCFSPLPGIATHMHEGVMSNYINWENFL
jgi:hypothetical protein